MSEPGFASLLRDIRACRICAEHFPHEPHPVLQVSRTARILIAGQAPGRRVQESGIPFDDPSGDRLRDWLGLDRQTFYDASQVAILPMAFCYPGTGKSGDLPPRPECAEAWRSRLLGQLPEIKLTVLVGTYAMKWHLGKRAKENLTDTVAAWRDYLPKHLPLPHTSPRNNPWLRKHPWFEEEVLPEVRKQVSEILRTD